jgi:hypothetical protein
MLRQTPIVTMVCGCTGLSAYLGPRPRRKGKLGMALNSNPLPSWNDTATRNAIVGFVEAVTLEGGPDFVPPEERVATFDNDGTLWTEKPMPIELGFILQRFAEMAAQDASLRDKQPFKAAYEKNYGWLGETITQHYQGDDANVKVLLGGILKAFAGMTVEDYTASAHTFLHHGKHPTRQTTSRPLSHQAVTAISCGR